MKERTVDIEEKNEALRDLLPASGIAATPVSIGAWGSRLFAIDGTGDIVTIGAQFNANPNFYIPISAQTAAPVTTTAPTLSSASN